MKMNEKNEKIYIYTMSTTFNVLVSMIGGFVLGIANNIVIPPATAASVPLCHVSLYSPPGSRKCAWMSIKPGRRNNEHDEILSIKELTGGCAPMIRKACKMTEEYEKINPIANNLRFFTSIFLS